MSIEAMKQALESFKKIHEGCGFVKKDNLSKESNELATLVRKDCNFAMEDLRQAIEQAEDAVAAEREACAKLAEQGLIGHTIAKAIRARGEK
jgi:hypothetical protein